MRCLLVIAFIALALAAATPKRSYAKFLATCTKKEAKMCNSCAKIKFAAKSCDKYLKKFVAVVKDSVKSEYEHSTYCLKHLGNCKTCLNIAFVKNSCTPARNALLDLFKYAEEKKEEVKEEKKEEKKEEVKEGKKEEKKEEVKEEKKEDTPALTDGLAQKAMSFYKSTSVKKGKAVKSLGETGISLYDGLPWDPKNAYELDNAKMDEYEDKILAQKVHYSMASDGNCSKKGITSDGVVAADFAALPILAFRDIDEAGMPIGWSSSTRPKKVAAILKDGEGKLFYLPCTCVGDAKGHAWPGGLAQTFLSTAGQKKGAWKFNSDNGTIKGPIIGKTISSLKDIRAGYGSVTYVGAKVSVQLNLEINKTVKATLKGYKLAGFIAWKE